MRISDQLDLGTCDRLSADRHFLCRFHSFDSADTNEEGSVARVVICPSCQSKGSVPDNAAAARIRCPKCGHAFDVSAATGPATSQSQSQVRNPAAPKRPKPTASAYEELDAVDAPLPAALSSSGVRRSAPRPATSQGMNQTHLIYALLGVGVRGRAPAERLDRRAVARRWIGRATSRKTACRHCRNGSARCTGACRDPGGFSACRASDFFERESGKHSSHH